MRKVLVADAVADGRELLRILLEHEGYEVLEAENSASAVGMALRTLPDLILVDVEIPNPNGYAAVREMRMEAALKRAAIVAVTDGTRRGDREQLISAGFNGYISKPLVMSVLREQLARLATLRQEA